MSSFQKEKKKSNGRAEYRAVQEDVEKKLAAGSKLLPLYEELVEAGKLTMSYNSFWGYVRGQGERYYPRHGKKTSYTCRAEFRAVQKEAESKLAAGFTIRQVHKELSMAGKLTMSYPSFYAYLQGQGKRIYDRQTKKQTTD